MCFRRWRNVEGVERAGESFTGCFDEGFFSSPQREELTAPLVGCERVERSGLGLGKVAPRDCGRVGEIRDGFDIDANVTLVAYSDERDVQRMRNAEAQASVAEWRTELGLAVRPFGEGDAFWSDL